LPGNKTKPGNVTVIVFEALSKTTISRVEPGVQMKKTDKCMSWVVYRMTIHGKVSGMNAVCEQREWDAMELFQPGRHALIQAGIVNEGEAEKLARNSPLEENHVQAIRVDFQKD
jgi:hypothetical protein